MNSFDPKFHVAVEPHEKPKKTCLLVLGMHRSGTSALTRVLSLAGAELPADLMGPNTGNELGHWESNRLVALHDQVLNELGSTWCDWRALELSKIPAKQRAEIKDQVHEALFQEYGDSPFFIVKDPRICRFAPLFLEALDEAGIDAAIIMPLRHPLEICESLKKRDGIRLRGSALLWLRHVLDAEKASRGRKRLCVSYEGLLADWRGTLEQISSTLDLKWPRHIDDFASQVDAFLSPNHRHQAYDSAALGSKPVLAGLVADTFHQLEKLAENGDSPETRSRFDTLRAEYARAEPFILGDFEHRGAKLARLEQALEDADRANARLASKLAATEEKLSRDRLKVLPPLYRKCWHAMKLLLPVAATDWLRDHILEPARSSRAQS